MGQRLEGFPVLFCGGGQLAHSPGPCPDHSVENGVVQLNPS